MKNKRKYNWLIRTLIFIFTPILLLCLMAVGLFFYMFSLPDPDGISTTRFPQDFTNSFSVWTTYENGRLQVEQIGLDRLDKYGMWIQFVNENGEEIFSYKKPAGYPDKYTAAELLALSKSEYANGCTLFVSTLDDTDEECSYIIGFPYNIGKSMLYYNGLRISRLSLAAKLLILTGFGVLAVSILAYSIWLSRKLSRVTGGIRALSLREYCPMKEKGTFREVYAALNKMNGELQRADQVQQETDRTRQEWITNITHDLKTPLSPVKGYAEMLADGSVTEPQEMRQCGRIILKNVDHTEKLINDLKLTYQLESGSVPYHPKEVRLARCVKEWVIDIINDPAFSGRDITFESAAPQLLARVDTDLLRRAVSNLMINALTHNTPDTKVQVSVYKTNDGRAVISVCDDGAGISPEAQARLFDRYYRGTNTKEKPQGSGLGLAIARQIAVLHGGDITVKSRMHVGTQFLLSVPAQN